MPRIPSDAFFDDTVLHDIRLDDQLARLDVAERQLASSNTYYPADFTWRDQTLAAVGHPLARHRQPQRREAGAAHRLRPLHHGSEVPRAEIGHPAQQHAGSVAHARAAEHAVLQPHGARRPSARRTPGCFINNDYAGLFTIVESVDKMFLKKNFGENDRPPLRVRLRQQRRRHVPFDFGYPGSGRRRCTRRRRSSRRRRKPTAGRRSSSGCSGRSTRPATRRGAQSIAEFLDLSKVHPPSGDRELPRRGGRAHRRLRAEQLLFLPVREQEPVPVPAVGQEQHVLGAPSPTISILRNIEDGPRTTGTGWSMRALKDTGSAGALSRHVRSSAPTRSAAGGAGDRHHTGSPRVARSRSRRE